MSEQEASANPLKEQIDKVVITPEDAAGAAEFWPHFEVAMSPELKAAFERFQADPSLENQNELKYQAVSAVGFTEHEAFQDEMFKEIVDECRAVSYDMKFDRELRETLTGEGAAKTEG
jgi:hypothetical protein